jgi:hypothetical protein
MKGNNMMYMAKAMNDDNITAMGESVADVWEQLQFGFELTDNDFSELEWFEIEPIKVTRKLEFVIE